ncbi:MAG: hypothetical protein ACKV2T_35430 [Kofleriaceae bacterium]
MRLLLLGIALAGCASAGGSSPSAGDDEPMADAMIESDACLDTDMDTVCNHLDQCPGADDAIDSDADTVADGCDDCPGLDDRLDSNGNQIPDCTELMTRTIDLKVIGSNRWRGWYNAIGDHTQANDNTITGLNGGRNYNSYFVFNLNFTASTVQSVTFEVEKESYSSSDATETLSIWDVTTAVSTLEANAANATAGQQTHNDLGSGTTFGTGTMQMSAANGSVVSIPLNAAAATAVTAALGTDFAIGVHLDTQPGWVRFSMSTEARVARLVIRYLP